MSLFMLGEAVCCVKKKFFQSESFSENCRKVPRSGENYEKSLFRLRVSDSLIICGKGICYFSLIAWWNVFLFMLLFM